MFKNSIKNLWCLLIIALPFYAVGSTPEALFKKGNECYAKSDYKCAISSYEQIIKAGHQSAVIYYNLGNAFYKTNDFPLAILYFEKAHKLAPGDDDISYNLQIANLKIKDKLELIPEFFLLNWWRSFLLILSAQSLSILSVVFFGGGFLLLITYLYTRSSQVKRVSFYGSIATILIGLALFFIAGAQESYLDRKEGAIVITDVVSIKSEPSSNAKSLFVIHEGTKVLVEDAPLNGWIKVSVSNGTIGWIKSEDLQVI
jgi:tetratricopeptide (TPR) repeat protein